MTNIEKACELSCERWTAALPDISAEPEFSKKYDRRIKKLFSQMRHDKYHKTTRKSATAILIAALLAATATGALANQRTRTHIIEKYDIYSNYVVINPYKGLADDEFTIGYIPEGYDLIESDDYTGSNARVYSNHEKDNALLISRAPAFATVSFNTEKYGSYQLVYNGVEYTVYQSDEDSYAVLWNTEKYIYDVSATVNNNLPLDKILKVASSIK